MIKYALSLYISLFLAAGPAAAQMQEAAVSGKAGASGVSGAATALGSSASTLPALPLTPAGLAGSLSGNAAPIVARIAAAFSSPETLRALAADPSPAAVYARALIGAPSAAARDEAVKALGEDAVIRIETAVKTLDSASGSSLKAKASLQTIVAEFAALSKRAPATLVNGGPDAGRSDSGGSSSSAPRPSKPSRAWRAVKRAAFAATLSLSMLASLPAVHAQDGRLPTNFGSAASSPYGSVTLPRGSVAAMLAQADGRQAQAEVVAARDINDAIAKWTPSTKVIVIGDPGLDQGSQKRLAAWLADKHWTVIIIQSNSGMSYRDAEGRAHYDNDAVEFGAGQGLYKKNGFSSFVDAQSGLPDGSILVITMEQRKLFLRNSEAQRVNGLDAESEFAGNLDRWAKARLRAGGDIMGAVKETVTNVDALLESAVASAASDARSAVADAKSAVDNFARARAAFMLAYPSVASKVGAVDIASLRAQVTAAEKALSSKNPSEAVRVAGAASSSAAAATGAMQGYESDFAAGKSALSVARADVDSLEKASSAFLKSHPKASGDLARPDLRALRERLKSAETTLAANPSGAKSAADSVADSARRVSAALSEHAGGADLIASAESVLAQLESRQRASSASTDLVTAKQALREARESHDLGASAWSSRLQSAKSALAAAELTISEADAAASRNAMLALIFWVLLGLGALGTGTFLNRRARKVRARAEEELAKWDNILETKLDAIIDQLDKRMDVYVGPVSGEKSRGWTGKTAELAAMVRSDAGYAKLLLGKARATHDEAGALVRPRALTPAWIVNLFWPSRYAVALNKLGTEPLVFKPEDGLDAIFGSKRDWRGDLYGEAKDYKPFSKTFDQLMSEFNARSKAAVAALDSVEKAATTYGAEFDAVAAKIGTLESKRPVIEAAAAKYSLFAVPSLLGAAKAKVEAMLASARETAKTDPVGGLSGAGARADALAVESAALAARIVKISDSEMEPTLANAAKLDAERISSEWIRADLRALSDQAEAAAVAIAGGSPGDSVAKFSAAADERVAYAASAALTATAIAKTRADIVNSGETVAAARARIGSALSLDAAKTLRETKADPTEYLSRATETVEKAAELLGIGKSESASVQREAADIMGGALAIVKASLDSLNGHDAVLSARRAETGRLESLVPERRTILDGIALQFADSVLALTSGDPSHPNANGTIADNIDEATAAVDAAKAKTEGAARARRAGELLKAADLLGQALAHQQIADLRLAEIAEKRARLDAATSANAKTLEALESKFRAWKTEIPDDRRSMKATLAAYDKAGKALKAARASVEATKGDPFKTGAALAAVSAALDQVWVQVSNDRDAYAEVDRSLKAARSQLDSAARLASDAKGDGVADSPAIAAAYRDIAQLETAYAAAVSGAQAEHGDWPTLDREADRVTSEAARSAAALKGELAAAARATEAISRAASKVREATNWTGSYGVSVPGSPGSGSIDSARGALNNGDYEGAIRYAENARGAAIAAIETAEAEVSRRRRAEEEEQRRQEEARRQRQREEDDRRRRSDDSSSSGGGYSSGGGGSSWGGGSGSSSGGGSSGW